MERHAVLAAESLDRDELLPRRCHAPQLPHRHLDEDARGRRADSGEARELLLDVRCRERASCLARKDGRQAEELRVSGFFVQLQVRRFVQHKRRRWRRATLAKRQLCMHRECHVLCRDSRGNEQCALFAERGCNLGLECSQPASSSVRIDDSAAAATRVLYFFSSHRHRLELV